MLDRVETTGFPDTLDGVIYLTDGNGNYEFNSVGGKLWNAAESPETLSRPNADAYESAYATAFGIEKGQISDPTGGARFFYSGSTPTGFFARAINSGRLVVTYTAGPFTFMKTHP